MPPMMAGGNSASGGTTTLYGNGGADTNDAELAGAAGVPAGGENGVGGAEPESIGVVVTATRSLQVHEQDGTATFEIALTARPTANVIIGLGSSDPTHAVVSPTQLVFTPLNWSAPQIVTVSGVNDDVADGAHFVQIETAPAISADPDYSGLDAANVPVLVLDDTDTGVGVWGPSGATTESGGTTTFSIVLLSKPTAAVTFPLSSSDVTEGTVPSSVTIEPVDWAKPYVVTVTGVDDYVTDGPQPYAIVIGQAVTTDPHYAGLRPSSVQIVNVDNE